MVRSTLAALAFTVLALGAAQAEETKPPACADSAHHGLDFWIGEWEVRRADNGALAGHSSIRAEDGGCVITEQWTSARSAYTGRSLNLFDARASEWRQFWVDSQGDVTDFHGAAIENGVRFVAEGDVGPDEEEPHFTRMTLTRQADGAVRQLGEASADGRTWTTRYDFLYRPRA